MTIPSLTVPDLRQSSVLYMIRVRPIVPSQPACLLPAATTHNCPPISPCSSHEQVVQHSVDLLGRLLACGYTPAEATLIRVLRKAVAKQRINEAIQLMVRRVYIRAVGRGGRDEGLTNISIGVAKLLYCTTYLVWCEPLLRCMHVCLLQSHA